MAISEAKRLMREQIKAQQKKSSENPGKTLTSFVNYFELGEDTTQWIPKASDKGEEHAFDIVLFKVGKNFPDMYCNLKEGDWAYLLDVGVHKNVGPGKEMVLCPNSFKNKVAKGDKKGCPSCERMAVLQANEKDKDKRYAIYQKYKAQRRVMYYVIARDGDKEEAKGVQVFDVYRPYMEDVLQDLAKATRGRDEITYADPDDGKTIYFKAVKKSTTNKHTGDSVEYSEYEAHEFGDRVNDNKEPYIIDEEIYMNIPPLDSYLTLRSYDEILEMLGPIDEDGKSCKPPASNDEDDEKEPRARGNRFAKHEEKVEEKVEDPPAEDDSEGSDECPHGHTLGKHFLKKSECEDCEGDIYNLCRKVKKEMKK